jgi:hypothetical protein
VTDNHDVRALAIIPSSLMEVQTLAEALSKSTLLPDALKGKAADVMVQILAGQELGLAPMASIRGVHIVQGKPLLSADTMVGLVLGSGVCEYFSCVDETATQVTYETKRKGSPMPQKVTWSDDDTKLAGLNTKDNWRLHKKQMRRARCKAILARDVYPDVLAGCYDPDEISVPASRIAFVPSANNDAVDAEFTDAPLDPLSAIETAESVEALKALAPQLNKLPADAKKAARVRYDAKMAALTQPAQEGAA